MKDLFQSRRFALNKTIKEIEEYANKYYEHDNCLVNKPFYHYNEWFGWRFYLKAIKHRDWKSLKKHIKSKFK